ncbi:hypothetical protein [Hyphomicrobium sp. D-2]|uniref:hypothetical protein n=1 Tax=Hyphomicrobium sp. D-2 TaxID=3041621 RepID=UPI0024563020|nr:hypothetical protein [Hyphomicrobium sp. D-2]MDH4982163.1 hypothetical protein [Hyphomicrobium sp. D-2]
MSNAVVQIRRAYQKIAGLRETAGVTVTLAMCERGIVVRARNSPGTSHSESLVLWDWLADPSSDSLLTYVDKVASGVIETAA